MLDGETQKQQGLDLVVLNNQEFVKCMREHAESIALHKGDVSADDLRPVAERIGIEPNHPNAWGAIFKGRVFRRKSSVKSRWPSNHGRYITLWELT
ncbi:MAG: hypothetical protein AAF662_10110 [Pseudomonadota bacterium]